MELFSKRPLLLALSAFLLGMIFTMQLDASLGAILLSISAGSIIVLFVLFLKYKNRTESRNIWAPAFLCSFAVFCAILTALGFFHTLSRRPGFGDTVTVCADVMDCSYAASYQTVYTVQIRTLDGKKLSMNAELIFKESVPYTRGDRLKLHAITGAFAEDIYGYNEERDNFSNGILLSLTAVEVQSVEKADPSLRILFAALRDKIASHIDRCRFSEAGSLLKALLLGKKETLESGVKLDFRRLGISHVLAISGLHFTALLGMVTFLLSLFGCNRKHIFLLLIPLSLAYMGLTGFSASVCRAGLMAILTFSAFLLGRTRDAYTALFSAVSFLLLIHPYRFYSLSLWLSFIATFTILVFLELFASGKFRSRSKVIDFLFFRGFLTVAITFFTLPLTALYFGEISWIAPLSNLIFLPLFEILLYITPLSVLLGKFQLIRTVTDSYAKLLLGIARKVCRLDHLLISVCYPFVFWISSICIVCTLVLLTVKLSRKKLVLLPCILGILLCGSYIALQENLQKSRAELFYTADHFGDSMVILDGRNTFALDISTGSSDAARNCEYLADLFHAPEFSGYLLTHYHNLHISQVTKLLSRTYTKTLYLPPARSDTEYDRKSAIIEAAETRGTEIIETEYNVPFRMGNMTVTLFTPQPISRSTHDIYSLRIELGGRTILYLGSSFSEVSMAEYRLLLSNADLILFGQHTPASKAPFALDTDALSVYASQEIASLSANGENGIVLDPGETIRVNLQDLSLNFLK